MTKRRDIPELIAALGAMGRGEPAPLEVVELRRCASARVARASGATALDAALYELLLERARDPALVLALEIRDLAGAWQGPDRIIKGKAVLASRKLALELAGVHLSS